MRCTCEDAVHVTRTIQIRNVPESLHRALKARARRARMSLSEYLLNEIRYVAERPTLEDLFARLKTRRPVRDEDSSAAIIRRHRDAS
jgi:antitoxin FitA